MSSVFLVDTNKQPLNPVHPGRARLLLKQGKAAVLKRYPFTLVLKSEVEQPQIQPFRLKLDPGSKTTGIVLVDDLSGQVLFAAELSHRGAKIKEEIESRSAVRRGRRARHTRYRKPRFDNRRKPKGWLAPSLMSRVHNTLTWVNRLRRLCPVGAISMELVRFDFQAQEHPEIAGVHYQQGTLAGYETREYLLAKWDRACTYCQKKDIPLQIEHIQARANGGTDRLSNLCLACEPCNKRKGTLDIAVFLAKKPDLLKTILAQAKKPLKDAAAVNSTRWALFEQLQATGLPVECGSGGRTKFNRVTRHLEKTHWLDAACVGASTPLVLKVSQIKPLLIKATGHGRRKMCVTNRSGFPVQHKERHKTFLGYATGDIVKAIAPKGTYEGRLAIRHRPSFRLGKMDIHPKYLRRLQRADGYEYAQAKGAAAFPPQS